jgi:hypothetical protein
LATKAVAPDAGAEKPLVVRATFWRAVGSTQTGRPVKSGPRNPVAVAVGLFLRRSGRRSFRFASSLFLGDTLGGCRALLEAFVELVLVVGEIDVDRLTLARPSQGPDWCGHRARRSPCS